MSYKDLPRLLTMSIVWLLLLVWYLTAHRLSCFATLALLSVVTALLWISGAELALARRRALLRECLVPAGRLYRLLGRRQVLLALEGLKALALGVVLLAGTASFLPRQWALMFADVLLLGLLLPRLYAMLENQMHPDYRFATARRWSVWISTGLLWLESLSALFFAASENFTGQRWQEVIGFGATAPDVLCAPMAQLAALGSAMQSLGLWSAQNFARSLHDLPQAFMAALGLLAAAGFSLVLAYAFSRTLIGSVGRPWSHWRLDAPEARRR